MKTIEIGDTIWRLDHISGVVVPRQLKPFEKAERGLGLNDDAFRFLSVIHISGQAFFYVLKEASANEKCVNIIKALKGEYL